MTLTYDQYVIDIANLVVVATDNPEFQIVLPNIITDAEQRIYRELDLLYTRVTNTDGSLTVNQRMTSLSTTQGNFLVVEEVNVITPSTATAATGSRTQLVSTSREFINITSPSDTTNTGVPEFWSMANNATIVVGPSPDKAYPIEVIGTVRPTALSSNNSSTILTQMLPDVFVAASMVFAAAYLKNFGASADDPRSGTSWEQLYQTRMGSALVEEFRKKYGGPGWTSKIPSQIATPPRM